MTDTKVRTTELVVAGFDGTDGDTTRISVLAYYDW
jgi:hypothetical protein